MKFSITEIQEKYDAGARSYNFTEVVPEWLGLGRVRRRLFGQASGKVLETGVGTGFSLKYYPTGVELTAVDMSEGMLDIARKRAASLALTADFCKMNVQEMAFEDGTFDTVCDSLCLCTYPDPIKALSEMMRVCKPGGKLLLLEHGLSSSGWLARFQHWRAAAHAKSLGCCWTREPQELMREAGIQILSARRHLLGMFHEVVAEPKTGEIT